MATAKSTIAFAYAFAAGYAAQQSETRDDWMQTLRIWMACRHDEPLTVSVTAVSAKGRLPVVVEVLKSLYEKKKQ